MHGHTRVVAVRPRVPSCHLVHGRAMQGCQRMQRLTAANNLLQVAICMDAAQAEVDGSQIVFRNRPSAVLEQEVLWLEVCIRQAVLSLQACVSGHPVGELAHQGPSGCCSPRCNTPCLWQYSTTCSSVRATIATSFSVRYPLQSVAAQSQHLGWEVVDPCNVRRRCSR